MALADLIIEVAVESKVLALALRTVAHDADMTITTERSAAAVVVCDRLDVAFRIEGRPRIMVAEMTAMACRRAVDAATSGAVDAVIAVDAPEQLPQVIQAVQAGLTVVPTSVVLQAATMPDLTPRQSAAIEALMAGRSYRQIGKSLHVSEATVKREITCLLELFDAQNRVGLVAAAHAAGVLPDRPRT